jgi:hypothetical protein
MPNSPVRPRARYVVLAAPVALATAACVESFDQAAPSALPASPSFAAPGEPAPGAAPPPAPPELAIISAQAAAQRALEGHDVRTPFGEGQDGTKLLLDFLADARARGAESAGDVKLYFATSLSGQAGECRIVVQPEGALTPVEVPARTVPESELRPVQRLVTEHEYRCQMVPRPATRTVTEYQNRCQMVSRPVTRMETTYTTQYDFSSHSSRSVPQMRSVTHYEMHNECRMEPVMRSVSETHLQQECRMEPVTRTVTRYEFQLASRFVPPHLEWVQSHRLRESEPVCYALPDATAAQGNRIEATLYYPRGRAR